MKKRTYAGVAVNRVNVEALCVGRAGQWAYRLAAWPGQGLQLGTITRLTRPTHEFALSTAIDTHPPRRADTEPVSKGHSGWGVCKSQLNQG